MERENTEELTRIKIYDMKEDKGQYFRSEYDQFEFLWRLDREFKDNILTKYDMCKDITGRHFFVTRIVDYNENKGILQIVSGYAD
jgi:hypothetical protein